MEPTPQRGQDNAGPPAPAAPPPLRPPPQSGQSPKREAAEGSPLAASADSGSGWAFAAGMHCVVRTFCESLSTYLRDGDFPFIESWMGAVDALVSKNESGEKGETPEYEDAVTKFASALDFCCSDAAEERLLAEGRDGAALFHSVVGLLGRLFLAVRTQSVPLRNVQPTPGAPPLPPELQHQRIRERGRLSQYPVPPLGADATAPGWATHVGAAPMGFKYSKAVARQMRLRNLHQAKPAAEAKAADDTEKPPAACPLEHLPPRAKGPTGAGISARVGSAPSAAAPRLGGQQSAAPHAARPGTAGPAAAPAGPPIHTPTPLFLVPGGAMSAVPLAPPARLDRASRSSSAPGHSWSAPGSAGGASRAGTLPQRAVDGSSVGLGERAGRDQQWPADRPHGGSPSDPRGASPTGFGRSPTPSPKQSGADKAAKSLPNERWHLMVTELSRAARAFVADYRRRRKLAHRADYRLPADAARSAGAEAGWTEEADAHSKQGTTWRSRQVQSAPLIDGFNPPLHHHAPSVFAGSGGWSRPPSAVSAQSPARATTASGDAGASATPGEAAPSVTPATTAPTQDRGPQSAASAAAQGVSFADHVNALKRARPQDAPRPQTAAAPHVTQVRGLRAPTAYPVGDTLLGIGVPQRSPGKNQPHR